MGIGDPKTIMIVEDDDFLRLAVRHVVLKAYANESVKVLEASSGETALELLERNIPDLAIVDLVMPGMGGEELCKRLHEQYPQVQILVLTGNDDPVAKDRLLNKVGVSNYMLKQNGLENFYTEIKQLI